MQRDVGWFILVLAIVLVWHQAPVNQQPIVGVHSRHENGESKIKQADLLGSLFFQYSRTSQHKSDAGLLLFHAPQYDFAVVTDLDRDSRDSESFTWKSYLQKGQLRRNPFTGNFSVEWRDQLALVSKTATENRSMELSELVRFNHLLLGLCDYTGLVYKIKVDEQGPHVFQRYAIADGNGNTPKPFKSEWATVKDGRLWVGSTGKEWTQSDGTVLHHNPEWVKTIDRSGRISNYDWRNIYTALRTATNTTFPGYLWHEAVHWDPLSRNWIILPRKASHCVLPYREKGFTGTDNAGDGKGETKGKASSSKQPMQRRHDEHGRNCEPFSPKADELKGTNLLIIANEDFSSIEVRTIGAVHADFGFTTIRKVPGTESIYAAIKVKETSGPPTVISLLTVFNLHGDFVLDGNVDSEGKRVPTGQGAWVHVGETPGFAKYEGLEFVDWDL